MKVEHDAMGEWWVDLGKFGWYPDRLPSEEGMTESSSGSESDSEGEREG